MGSAGAKLQFNQQSHVKTSMKVSRMGSYKMCLILVLRRFFQEEGDWKKK